MARFINLDPASAGFFLGPAPFDSPGESIVLLNEVRDRTGTPDYIDLIFGRWVRREGGMGFHERLRGGATADHLYG